MICLDYLCQASSLSADVDEDRSLHSGSTVVAGKKAGDNQYVVEKI